MGLSSFVHWLLYSSLMGSVLIGLIVVIRWICKDKIGASWQYLIWFLLIFKLLVPYAPASDFSLFNIFNNLDIHSENYFTSNENTKTEQNLAGKFPWEKIVNGSDDYYLSVNRSFFESKDNLIFLVWLIGVISFTSYTIKSTVKLQNIIKQSSKVQDCCVLKVFEECRQLMKVKKNPILIESGLFRSPKVVGVRQPYIMLPIGVVDSLNKDELRYILLHELAHLRRNDLYINWITAFLQIVHWFNPLIWYAFYQMRNDRELACDAFVLNHLRPEEYKNYGAAIIAFLEKYSYPDYRFTTAGLASGKKHIKDRLEGIISYQRGTAAGVILRTVLLVLLSCFVLTNAKESPDVLRAGEFPQQNPNTTYKDLSNYFKGYDGAFVLFDKENEHYLVYNNENSNKRISPDSTYKIISSLVALETGVLPKDNTRLTWDGIVYPFEPWNKDQTLTSAMGYSANWYFQRIDSSVGEMRIRNYLKQIGYGNYNLEGGISEFWMESSLKISPMEQVEVLKKLCTYDMPFSQENIDIVKNAIKLFEQDNIALYGKTGTGSVNGRSRNGWFVGFVETDGRKYIFATNIRGEDRADGASAKNITLSILKDENIL